MSLPLLCVEGGGQKVGLREVRTGRALGRWMQPQRSSGCLPCLVGQGIRRLGDEPQKTKWPEPVREGAGTEENI